MSIGDLLLKGDRAYAARELVAASGIFRRCFVLAPGDLNLSLRLAVVSADLGDLVSSAIHLNRASAINPGSADVYFNQAALRLKQRLPDLAAESATKALLLDPARWGAYSNRAVADQARAMAESALHWYGRSLQLCSSDNDLARVNLGQLLLSLGRFAEGWAHFAQRFSVDTRHLKTALPRFDAKVAPGKVLLWGDQGVGDQVMFASMLPDWVAKGIPFTLRVDDRLVALFSRSFPTIEVVGESIAFDERAYSAQISLGDLGLFFRRSIDDFHDRSGAFLLPDVARARALGRQLRRSDAEVLIGISWRSHNADTGVSRSLSLLHIMETLALPGARLVNLQYGDTAADTRTVSEYVQRSDWVSDSGIDNTQDLDGLAAVIAACDLVITIGNTTAHIAAAIGQETWVLVPKAPAWRWMQHGHKTPWYDKVEIFRQAVEGDWDEPLRLVQERLRRKLGSRE